MKLLILLSFCFLQVTLCVTIQVQYFFHSAYDNDPPSFNMYESQPYFVAESETDVHRVSKLNLPPVNLDESPSYFNLEDDPDTHSRSKPIECAKFKENEDLNIYYDNKLSINRIAFFTCKDRKKHLQGSTILTCQSNGHWSGNLPNCTPECAKFEKNEDLKIHYVNKLSNNRSALLTCKDRNKILQGPTVLNCQSNGRWSGDLPKCIACGISADPTLPALVVGGGASHKNQWPWQAAISIDILLLEGSDEWLLKCGASLINEWWLISAAHCFAAADTPTQPKDAKLFRVHLGKYYRSYDSDDENVQVRNIQQILIYPQYDPARSHQGDIALLKLDSPAEINANVRPVCLPTNKTSRRNLAVGKRGIVAGWGRIENSLHPEVLQKATVEVVTNADCSKTFANSLITDNVYCAGEIGKEKMPGACLGDSGGPMVFSEELSGKKKWVLEGIVSWGKRDCGSSYSIFTRVSKFLDWIHNYV